MSCILHYKYEMSKSQTVQIRVTEAERIGFRQAAKLAGIPLSSWVRERLRVSAIRELEHAGQRVPFIEQIKSSNSNG